MNRSTALVVLTLACAGCDRLETATPEARVCASNVLRENQIANGSEITVAVTVEKASCVKRLAGKYWGSADSHPDTVVTGLQITLNAQPVTVRVSTFSDLGDIGSVKILPKSDDLVVQLQSSGETSYLADITIRASEIVERRVYFPNFYDEAFEHTVYRFAVE